MKKICVIGSINMDLIAYIDNFPKPGETIMGSFFKSSPGGKGANQAIAAARLGGDVCMFGRIGDDFFGQEYIKVFEQNDVKHFGVETKQGVASGIAVIEVNNYGENHIVVIPGANGLVDYEFIDNHFEFLKQFDIFLFQLEIPMETVIYAMKRLKALGKIIILDPAPAKKLPDELYSMVDFLTPNETEISILTGIRVEGKEDIFRASELLISKGASIIIAKAGSKGAYRIDKSGIMHIPAFNVDAVDTTAAGDSFNGGFAYKLSLGSDICECIRFGNAVAALSTTAFGAQDAMPGIRKVEQLINEQSIIEE